MPELIYLFPSFIFLLYIVGQEPEESDGLKMLKEMLKHEEAKLDYLRSRNKYLLLECNRLERVAGLLN